MRIEENRLSEEQIALLFDTAEQFRKRAYAPYSHFQVGAALLTKEGRIYGGLNIENAAYSPTNCAERTAFFHAVSNGERNFAAIMILGGMENEKPQFCTPCGVCRQVMAEFCDPDTFVILSGTSPSDCRQFLLRELLPYGFTDQNLQK
ncbi:MAG: cytidine deaminase [Lachnospiraceae bacterium]